MKSKKTYNLSGCFFLHSFVFLFSVQCVLLKGYNPEHLERVVSGEKNLKNLDLDDADLSNSDLSDCDFSGSSMRRARLQGANLARSILDKTDLTDANFWPCKKSIKRPGFYTQVFYQLTNVQDIQCKDANLTTKKLKGAYFVGAAGLTKEQRAHLKKYGAFLTSPIFTKPNLLKKMVLDDLGSLSAGINVYVLIAGNLFKVLDQADSYWEDVE